MRLIKIQSKIPFSPHVFSNYKVFKGRALNCIGSLLMGAMIFSVGPESAVAALVPNDLSFGYSNCSFTSSGSYSKVSVTIKFKDGDTHSGGNVFWTRAIVLYTYDENGNIEDVGNITNVRLNNVDSSGYRAEFGYRIYQGINDYVGDWTYPYALTANITFTVANSSIEKWPAVGVRAANYTRSSTTTAAESTGMAYLGPSTKDGICTLVATPEAPPPAIDPTITMSAPDWDLGELPRGEETTLTLPATKDQLCFSYEGSTAIANQKYLINATNSNGLSADGQYLLINLEDSSQTTPYTLTLANSTDSVLLPNTQNRLFSLDTGGRTCFTPTFKAHPDKTVKGGAYSDILTFTVVAKP